MQNLVPVILSGGAGTRLWPLSRIDHPKQFLALTWERSLVQQTAERLTGAGFGPPLVVAAESHRFLVAHHLAEIGIVPERLILEPFGRNTAAALAVAAVYMLTQDRDALLVATPADHVIDDAESLRTALRAAANAAAGGFIATVGIPPDGPYTGYGYIRAGEPSAFPGCLSVATFIEKPDASAAARFVEEGGYYWNSGLFCVSAKCYVAELGRYAPDILAWSREAVEAGEADGSFFRLDPTTFANCPSNSIDYAVMERTERAVVVPTEIRWRDVGSWLSLWQSAEKDPSGNAVSGEAVLHDTERSYVFSDSDGPLVATLGIDDALVIATEDAVLVASKDRAQDVKAVVEALACDDRDEHRHHRVVHRPWGTYRRLSWGRRFQVKELVVRPGARLSLQLHEHRAEHWVVVEGVAEATCGEKSTLVHENESLYIPLRTIHRLRNPGSVPLRIVEVQSGQYLGEDDIVRFADDYGRTVKRRQTARGGRDT